MSGHDLPKQPVTVGRNTQPATTAELSGPQVAWIRATHLFNELIKSLRIHFGTNVPMEGTVCSAQMWRKTQRLHVIVAYDAM